MTWLDNVDLGNSFLTFYTLRFNYDLFEFEKETYHDHVINQINWMKFDHRRTRSIDEIDQ
jgi:hypothetical protein